MKKSHTQPLKWSMTVMLVLGWLLPLLIIAFSLLYLVTHTINSQIERTIHISTEKAVEICDLQLSETLAASKMASYNPAIREAYLEYRESGVKGDFMLPTTNFLNQQYKYDYNFLSAMVFVIDDPELFCFTYNTYRDNNSGSEGYERIKTFREKYMAPVLERSKVLDTRTELLLLDEHLYMIRNLVDAAFHPIAMVVVELSPEFMFESLNSVWGALEYEIYLDGVPLFEGSMLREGEKLPEYQAGKNSGYRHTSEGAFSYSSFEFEDQEILCLIHLDSETLVDDVAMLRWILVLVVLFVIPLVIMIFHFFHTKITKPVDDLVRASKEIAEGNYGHQVSETGNSREFDYLDAAFNAMSVELKHQFEQIYLEELALKDARIKALQSQINPHFLNNTLEIINWEARMNGNDKVSGMIEALATMLNATMNRRHRRYITLAEELEYVDAYLYIIKQRLGDRFQVEREIDSSLLQVEVPALIIQPIVENAVEHGVQGRKQGTVSLHIFEKNEKMYIEVINDGALSERDRARIDYLLGEDFKEENEHHVSLGIRNVDKRLRIIYGEDCGLSIKSDKEEHTISTIIVKIDNDNNKSQ